MTDERYQKIMADLGMPNSRSLLQALQQVANEAAQETQAAERGRWRAAAEYAAHQLEQARIWGGMEWHYNPLHPLHYRSALERLRDVLRA